MNFLQSSLDWFLGTRSSHMGPHQYFAHDGMRDGKKMSGALLWAESELKTVSAAGNMVNAETSLLHKVVTDIRNCVSLGTPIVELGPGTAVAFKNKTMPLVRKLESSSCTLVDESVSFLKQIANSQDLERQVKINLVVDDFFENETAYLQESALICSFGSTISNFSGHISKDLPQDVLVNGLSKMAHAAQDGWMLIGFDSDHDGDRIKEFYQAQALFQLNIFDRMAIELPIEGDFDPKAFNYNPEWIPSSGQLAHTAIVSRNMNFKLGGVHISLQEGQKLHIKNSYKLAPDFFEKCCAIAGLEILQAWANNSPAKIYLLKIPSKQLAVPLTSPNQAYDIKEANVA